MTVLRPVIWPENAIIELRYRLYKADWLARGCWEVGKGMNFDVFKDGHRVALRDGVRLSVERNSDVALIKETLEAVIRRTPLEGLVHLRKECKL